MNEEIVRKMICAGEKPEGLPEKPPIEKPIATGFMASTKAPKALEVEIEVRVER
jgi:hypothetical protein